MKITVKEPNENDEGRSVSCFHFNDFLDRRAGIVRDVTGWAPVDDWQELAGH